MFPLGTVLFPGGILPLHIFEPRYRTMMDDCLGAEGAFGVVLISRGSEVGGDDQRVGVGTEARIEEASRFPDGRWAVIASGTRRIVVESWLPDDPYPLAIVRTVPPASHGVDLDALDRAATAVRRARGLLSELGQVPAWHDSPPPAAVDDPEAPIWELCASAPLGPLDRQRLLEIGDATERVSVLTELTRLVADDLHRLLAEGSS
jgi:Lon protease-like protein